MHDAEVAAIWRSLVGTLGAPGEAVAQPGWKSSRQAK